MLVPKKMTAKKMYSYIALIVVMFSGSLFFVYKTNQLGKTSNNLNNSSMLIQNMGQDPTGGEDAIASMPDLTTDLDILEDPRFINLEEYEVNIKIATGNEKIIE